MIVGEALEVMVEGVEACRGQDPDLAHAAAPALADPARGADRGALTHQDRADRGAEPLREAHHHRVGGRGPVADRHAGRHAGVP